MRKFALALATLLSVGATPALAAPVTIAALGDSLTQGYGLPAGQGFVPQLNEWLAEQGADAKVLNAGVSGDTTAGGLSRVDWTLTPEVEAVIVTLGGNDLLRGIDPANSRANLDAILSKIDAHHLPVLLIGMAAPGNFGPEFQRDFDAIYPELAKAHGTLYAPNFLGTLESMDDRQATLAKYIQPDGIHPNAAGVALIVQDLGPKVLELIDAVSLEGTN